MKIPVLSITSLSFCLCLAAHAASIGRQSIPAPEASAAITGADYCFAHTRALEYERQPPSYLVLHLHIKVAYKNPGARPLILPIGRDTIVYTALKTGIMKITAQPNNFPDDSIITAMKELPADVSPDNPVNPANDVFRIIPAGGPMTPGIDEDVVLPVNHKTLLRHDPDLRGHRIYVRLQFDHQEIAPELEGAAVRPLGKVRRIVERHDADEHHDVRRPEESAGVETLHRYPDPGEIRRTSADGQQPIALRRVPTTASSCVDNK